jgi:hypothetical protein
MKTIVSVAMAVLYLLLAIGEFCVYFSTEEPLNLTSCTANLALSGVFLNFFMHDSERV